MLLKRIHLKLFIHNFFHKEVRYAFSILIVYLFFFLSFFFLFISSINCKFLLTYEKKKIEYKKRNVNVYALFNLWSNRMRRQKRNNDIQKTKKKIKMKTNLDDTVLLTRLTVLFLAEKKINNLIKQNLFLCCCSRILNISFSNRWCYLRYTFIRTTNLLLWRLFSCYLHMYFLIFVFSIFSVTYSLDCVFEWVSISVCVRKKIFSCQSEFITQIKWKEKITSTVFLL